MPFLRDANDPTRNRRVEYGQAEEEREKRRAQDAARIDPAAAKWRYRPAKTAASTTRQITLDDMSITTSGPR
ncbi:hypothetical protein R52603_03785 [Paraburkholderia saeva]|uniref:Uncharacterized protein n=1 Tax=Paraburkholderia saeva TaxID=2777537 RepID=A0A9N8S1T7_9BURK|nr:hypothetical protein R52603_03785 [Paraburkholderia saeva]CAG4911613.1 hypothetical protein R70241_03946 [Paraburkholderia saeva]CAG4925214.1 hypothetical protein LMG31841_05464 [Paraburkholderia saeva]